MTLHQRHWAAIASAFVVNGSLYGVWASRIPAVAKTFSLEHDFLGLLLLVLALGALVSFPLAGRISDRQGADYMTRVTTIMKAGAVVLLAIAPNIWTLAASLFVFGACHGSMDVCMNAWAAEIEKAARKHWMPGFHAVWSFGAGLGALSGYAAVSFELSYTVHFLLAALIVPAIGLLGMRIEWTSKRSQTAPHGPLFSLPKGPLLFAGIFAFCATLGEGAMADWSALYLIEVALAEESIAPLGLAVFSAAMVFMRLLGGPVIDRLGTKPAGIASGIAAVIGTGLAVWVATPVISMVGFLFMGFGYALAMPLAYSRAGNDPVIPAAQAIASVATLGYGGMLLGPAVIGFLTSVTSLRGAFGVLLVLAVAMIVVAPLIKPSAPAVGEQG